MRRRFSESVGNTLSLPHAAGRTECDGRVELLYFGADRAAVYNQANDRPAWKVRKILDSTKETISRCGMLLVSPVNEGD
jgi:hypothetical protein